MRWVLALLVLFQVGVFAATPQQALAQSPSDRRAMAAANQLYENSEFQESGQLYQQLVDRGFRNSALYYNLGNAYYRQGDLGRAVVNYLRAEGVAPRDPEIRSNLALAREQAIDPLDFGNQVSLNRLAYFSRPWLTLNELALASLGLWSLSVLLMIGVLIRRRGALRRLIAAAFAMAALVFIASALLFGSRAFVESRGQVVVVADVVDVSSGPGNQYDPVFTLHSGAEANLLELRGSWMRLEVPGNQQQGWVQATDVERVAALR